MRLSKQQSPALTLALLFCVTLGRAPTLIAADATPADMRRLAHAGDFEKLFLLLKQQPSLRNDAKVTALLDDLETYRKHAERHTRQRREAYNEAYGKMQAEVKDGRLNEAVLSAIEANSLADDPAAMLKLPEVVELVAAAEAKARHAEAERDWLESLNLYRALELLFEDNSRHKSHVERIERHLRLLRFYAPESLEQLYAARLAKLKEQRRNDADADNDDEEDDPIKVSAEPWQQRLKGIQMSMLRQTLSRAAHHHIGNPGYQPLLRGAIDALMVLADTPQLKKTFPMIDDAERLKQFTDGLARIGANVAGADAPMNFLQASAIVDDVTDLNRVTLDLPEAVLVFEMTDGATGKLDDFTSLIWPHDLEQFERNVEGKFYGVGIQISQRNGRLTVVSPLEGTPAHRAGIRAGDIIVEVDGARTDDWSLDRAVREITGEEGTEVKLGIERTGEKKLLAFSIKRAEIVIESIKGWDHKAGGGWTYYIDEASRIGYVRMTQFIPQTVEGLDAAVQEMENGKGLNGLILDLRGNPGGLLSSAIDICDRFVGEGTIVSTVNSANRETRRYSARADRTYRRFPMVVLINQGSASASEIVSGAIQDYQRGTIIGDNSFGKGSVQDLFPIDGGAAALKLTTQYYRIPGGRIIHRQPGVEKWGIQPDLRVRMTTTQIADLIRYRQDVDVIRQDGENPDGGEIPTADKMIAEGIDPQLNVALLVLKTNLVAEHIALAQGGRQ